MEDEKDLYRKVPPPESLIPTPADVLKALGVPTPEERLADFKDNLIKIVPYIT
jgi:hypothetical protein